MTSPHPDLLPHLDLADIFKMARQGHAVRTKLLSEQGLVVDTVAARRTDVMKLFVVGGALPLLST